MKKKQLIRTLYKIFTVLAGAWSERQAKDVGRQHVASARATRCIGPSNTLYRPEQHVAFLTLSRRALAGFSILLIILALPLSARAQELNSMKQQADSLYAAENYEEAVKIYSSLADTVRTTDVCYNLGCCYYRLDDMAHAVLWFERAAQLSPSDKDVRFNLELARSKTIDRIAPRHEMFFTALFHSLVQMFGQHQWAAVCLALFVASLLALCLFLFSGRIVLRKTGFYAALVFFLLAVLGNVCACSQKSALEHRLSAIIVASSVNVKSTPSESGNDLFVLHEGTRVEIRDNTMKDWCEVQIADGKVGWIERSVMEKI